ncbi:MAG: hypothetical protein JJ895_11820 [Balneolaceae bacterium]|nr:hypothetical protein [Balneolaceae bacterium]
METLNKNWFAFTLCAIVFGLIGYLLGSQNSHSCPMHRTSGLHMGGGEHEIIIKDGKQMGEHEMRFYRDGDMDDDNITVDVQSDTTEDGEIRVTVKKMKIEDGDN